MAQWIQSYATDMLRGDVAITGGITPLIKICHIAEGFGMKAEIHHGGNSLNPGFPRWVKAVIGVTVTIMNILLTLRI
jgi:hypothetical protein